MARRSWFSSVRAALARSRQKLVEEKHVPGPTTPSLVATYPADSPLGQPGANLEERLDEALQESFPTSDPVSIRIE